MYESVVSEAGFADRLPGPVRRVWDALGALPEGREPDERVFFVAARIRLFFSIFFGAFYWNHYFVAHADPFYRAEGLRLFYLIDTPLRLLWMGGAAWVLAFKPGRAWLGRLNYLAMSVEVLIVCNIVISTGSMSSAFLWAYPVVPIVNRIAFGRAAGIYSTSLSAVMMALGATLTIKGVLPEATWYADYSRATFANPDVYFMSVMLVFDALLLGPVLGEWAMHLAERREKELRAALEEIERKQRALVEAEALAAIGEFVRGAAHEIGNPLSSARSVIESAREELAADESADLPASARAELVEDLQMAGLAQQRVAGIVSILHELSVHTEVKPGRFELSRALAVGAAGVETRGELPGVVIDGNEGQLGDAIARIVENARQFGAGKVWIELALDEEGQARVRVCDDGPGFDEGALAHAAEPFFTTRKAERAHLGLGLFIARVIAGRMGGLLEVANGDAGGARVSIHLPAAAPAPESAS
ncbi:MAG: HAMP domain-containing histidine kinase [Chrysiogenetes bacterium]|nr:HAMP domain-containing histidine kinase [Chrysiogenetes bacterium]